MKNEFEFIHNLKSKFGLSKTGDDCAVLPKDSKTDMVITADLLVEDIDFRLDWITPEFLGHKALAVSLSDISAMGAVPTWAMLSIGIPANIWNSDFIDRFYEGWFALAKQFEVELIGGDVSRTPDKIVFDSIVAGEVPTGQAVLRSGAKPGDSIYVTETLGGAAGGLMLLESGFRYSDSTTGRKEMIARQLRPTARVSIGKLLMEGGLATAMIDISDGLSSDLAHLCNASGVGAKIYTETIPVDPNLSELSALPEERMGLAINGGEDFELLFTADKEKISATSIDRISCIGEITPNIGVIEIARGSKIEILKPKGFRHFSKTQASLRGRQYNLAYKESGTWAPTADVIIRHPLK